MFANNPNKRKFLASVAFGALAVGSYAQAQEAAKPPVPADEEAAATTTTTIDEETAANEQDVVTVTGSLLRRDEFTSSSPIQVITAEAATLEGMVDTAEILQGSSVAQGSTQINGNFGGFVVEGGTGVNTISLRGLGAQRSLVLFNGRRLGPAGTQGQVGAVDLNVIPDAVVQRYEILKDGASSIYGSDAVAGVVNVITRRSIDKPEINLNFDMPFDSGGSSFGVSGAYGLNWENGSAVLSASYEKFDPLTTGDRDFLSCAQDYVFSVDTPGVRRDLFDTRPDGQARPGYKCFNALVDVFDDNNGGRRWVFDAALNRFRPRAAGAAGTAETPNYNPKELSRTVIPETERMSVYATMDYDLGFAEVFADALWNNRTTEQKNWRQFFPFLSSTNPGHPGNVLNPTVRSQFGAGPIPAAFARPITLVPFNDSIDVGYYSLTGGLRGDFGDAGFLSTWDWELTATTSKSDGDYDRLTIPINRAIDNNQFITLANGASVSRPVARNVAAGTGFRCEYPTDESAAAFSGWVNAFNAAVAAGQPLPAQPALQYAACPAQLNYFTRDFIYGNLTPEQAYFMLVTDKGNTVYDQTTFAGMVRGELFDLPAGAIGFAVGAERRTAEIDDLPGFYSRNNLQWGLSSAVATTGDDEVTEFFGELEVPLIKGAPGFEELTVNVSGRQFDYKTVGEDSVWKAGINWQVTPTIRLRATKGTSFRAPALYELYLGNLTSFAGQLAIDPCDYTDGPPTNSRIATNCAAAGLVGWIPFGSSAEVTAGGGAGSLASETSEAKTIGLILTPTWSDISVALDYFEIDINDQIAQLGAAAIISGCYASEDFTILPNGQAGGDPLCTLFTRDVGATSPRLNQILGVNNDYVNINSQTTRGLDLTARYEHETKLGDFSADLQGTWTFEDEFLLFSGEGFEPDIFNGQIGEPDFTANLRLQFARGDWDYNWSTNYVSRTSNDEFFGGSTFPLASRGPGLFYFKQFTEPYLEHAASIRYSADSWTVVAGIDNVFNEIPPYVSTGAATRRGNAALVGTQYDYRGRSLFVNLTKTF